MELDAFEPRVGLPPLPVICPIIPNVRSLNDLPAHLKSWRYEPKFCVNVESAVKADISKQSYSPLPVEWYIDESIKCMDCSKGFTFQADEQKHWYEDLQFNLSSKPKRCKECNAAFKKVKNETNQLNQHLRNIKQGINTGNSKEIAKLLLSKIESAYGFTPSLYSF